MKRIRARIYMELLKAPSTYWELSKKLYGRENKGISREIKVLERRNLIFQCGFPPNVVIQDKRALRRKYYTAKIPPNFDFPIFCFEKVMKFIDFIEKMEDQGNDIIL